MSSEIKRTMEQAKQEMELLHHLFSEVRLLGAEELGLQPGTDGDGWQVFKSCRKSA